MFSPASMVAGIRDSLILFPMREGLSSGIDNLIFVDTSDSFQAICITRPLDARNGSREYGIDAWDGGSSCSYWRNASRYRGVSVYAPELHDGKPRTPFIVQVVLHWGQHDP